VAFTLNLQDIRFLLSRVRGEFMPEELGGLAAQGPTGIRSIQGVGNAGADPAQANYWFGAADTLFIRDTFNRLTSAKKNDIISSPFANAERGPTVTVTIGDTVRLSAGGNITQSLTGTIADSLNPRNISNLVSDSSDGIGFSAISATDPNYAAKVQLSLQDNPTGRISPVSGAVNPLVSSVWTAQLGQFFAHGLDFVNKGVDGKVRVELMPSDGLYTAGRATSITGSRNNTVNVTIGEGSTDALLVKMGMLAQQGVTQFGITATLTKPSAAGGADFRYEGTLVLNNTLITIAASNETELATQINLHTPVTGVVATINSFPTVPGVSEPGAFKIDLLPAVAESFNLTSPFIDMSQNYGSDPARTFFVREYLSEAQWRTSINNPTVEASLGDLTTGRLVNAGATVNGETSAGIATWKLIKENAAKVGIILHDADVTAMPMIAFDDAGGIILGDDGMPRMVALNKVTGEVIYITNTDLTQDAAITATGLGASAFVLMTTKHSFLIDMGVRLPALGTAAWNGRDLADVVTPGQGGAPGVNLKTALEAHIVAGEGRLNENIGLTAVHDAFLTEHNRMVTQLKQNYGFTGDQPPGGWTWTDPLTNATTVITGEELFQQAKIIIEMHYQHLLFDQFIRKISPNVGGFLADPLVNANISAEFAHAVYRFGHSMLPEAFGMRQNTDATSISTVAGSDVVTITMANHGLLEGSTIDLSSVDAAIGGIAAAGLNGTRGITVTGANTFTILAETAATATATGTATDKIQIDINRGLIDAFLNPQSYKPGTTAKLVTEGSAAQVSNRIDHKVTDALRDNLVGQPLDLATLNLIRGRDGGIPTLNEMRLAIQGVAPALLVNTLNPYTSWNNFRDNLKGTLAEQNATVKNFIMAYASDAVLTQFGSVAATAAGVTLTGQASTHLAQWYTLRESTVLADQTAYMTGLKAATDAAFANATFMGTSGNGDYNRIDAWIGGLAEREVVGGMLGSTFDAVFAMQMMDLQNGDLFYYLGRVPAQEFFIENMEGTQFADIIMRGTGATDVYADIFSVADKYLQVGDTAGNATFANLAALQRSTTTTEVINANGDVVVAALGKAGVVNGVFTGNPGNYVDARGVLNPNGIGNASEMITGSDLADRINGLGGNDTIRGGLGNDTINGGAGVDFLYGGDGNDTLFGGIDSDFMYGEAGNDTMRGEIGADIMFGGYGNDTLYGGVEADIINGGAGDDTLYGGNGVIDPLTGILDAEAPVDIVLLDDNINGGTGNDILYGGGGWDTLAGMSGHDILIPGTGGNAQGGRDVMNGGEGDDIFIVEDALSFESQDFSDSGLLQAQLINKGPGFRQGNGLGIDEVRFTMTVATDIVLGVTNALAIPQAFQGIERVVIGTGLGATANRTGTAAINIDASLVNPNVNLGLEILGNAGANIIVGTAFGDILDGGAGLDTLEGGTGDDVYIIDDIGDLIVEATGSGSDTVVVNAAFNYVLAADADIENIELRSTALQATGNALDNRITGNASNNILRGLDGNDILNGGAGNDELWGGAGFDTLTGGAGNDVFKFDNVANIGNSLLLRETVTDFTLGDRLDFSLFDANTDLAGIQQFTFIEGDAFTAAGQLRYEGGILYGNVNAAVDANGDMLADFQVELAGLPTLTAASFVSRPVVSVVAPAVAGILEGNVGNSAHVFTVQLDQAAATAVTVNWAVSGTGVNAANAADFANGNLPNGTVTIAAGATSAVFTVQVRGDTTVELNETFQVTLSNANGSGATIGTATAISTILNEDVASTNGTTGNDTLNGTANADTINGLAGNDIITGLAGNDTLNGGTGNDTVDGGDGDDTLNGGGGTDILLGGAGNDILIGSTGRTSMTGGAGADRFQFGANIAEIGTAAATRDIIVDFSAAQLDIIDLSAIDANTRVNGNQAFTFIGSAAFTDIGQLRYANGVLEGNVDRNLGADFAITLQFSPVITAADLVL